MAKRLPTWQTALASCLLTLYFVLAVSATLDKCTTYDEIVHLTAGYSYWLFDDYRLQPENGNLPQRWAALPLLFSRPTFPDREGQPAWYRSDVWKMGDLFFYHSGNDADAMLLQGRVMIALLAVVLGVLVFVFSRRLFGPHGGLVSVILYVFCPNLLAHGPLITSDLTASLFFLAGLASAGWLLHELSWRTVLVNTLVLAGLFLSKFSAPIMVPVIVLMIVVRLIDGRPLRIRWRSEKSVASRRHQAEIFFFAWPLQMALVAAVIWLFYGCRFAAFAQAEPGRDRLRLAWEEVVDGFHVSGDMGEIILGARDRELLPEGYLYGFAYTLRTAQERNAFLNGEHRKDGWRWFFPYAFLVKTPLGVFVVLALAGLSLRVPTSRSKWRGLGQGFYATAPLWLFLAVYWSFAVTSRLNIGLRHILPTYAPLYILAGAAARGSAADAPARSRSGWGVLIHRLALAAALGWVIVSSLWTWPNYLTYFNEIVGGPSNGYKHLVDSSLDWGQDLPAMRRYLKTNETEPVYLIYFGKGDPDYYGIAAMRPNRPLTEMPDKFDVDFRPGIYFISATYLQGVYLKYHGPWTPDKEQLVLRGKQFRWLYNHRDDPEAKERLDEFGGEGKYLTELNNYRSLLLIRLMNFLRQRQPDDNVNHSILIYRVSGEDLKRALEL